MARDTGREKSPSPTPSPPPPTPPSFATKLQLRSLLSRDFRFRGVRQRTGRWPGALGLTAHLDTVNITRVVWLLRVRGHKVRLVKAALEPPPPLPPPSASHPSPPHHQPKKQQQQQQQKPQRKRLRGGDTESLSISRGHARLRRVQHGTQSWFVTLV